MVEDKSAWRRLIADRIGATAIEYAAAAAAIALLAAFAAQASGLNVGAAFELAAAKLRAVGVPGEAAENPEPGKAGGGAASGSTVRP